MGDGDRMMGRGGGGRGGEFPAEALTPGRGPVQKRLSKRFGYQYQRVHRRVSASSTNDNTRRSHRSAEENESRNCLWEAGGIRRHCRFKGKLYLPLGTVSGVAFAFCPPTSSEQGPHTVVFLHQVQRPFLPISPPLCTSVI